ncbi:EF-hand calcium-binding domain-containing protein 5-like [Haliotis rufescens]|uniref:EF-hand calcium-binding domain-containing protein 5-like n=1 Tax=Haliotis rufescens TaxID=6454 RepID=UPI00201E983F|nr:EF-hand calcium-binding domain-containing protein 5-like [Haliotis rufescens]
MAEVACSPTPVGSVGSAGSAGRVTLSEPRTPSAGSRAEVRVSSGQLSKRSSAGSFRVISAGSARKTPSTPDYMKPIVRSAVRRWKRLHEQSMMKRLVGIRNEKKEHLQAAKEDARKLARKIPTELLAKEWLQNNEATVEVRAYLVDKVFPTLILGVEKLLCEADKRGLSEVALMDPNFNPLNFLAQYLLRNNPKYSNFAEASPYVRGLREVAEELRKQLFHLEDNRLARIKAEAKRKRDERELKEMRRLQEKQRREDCLLKQFTEWMLSSHGKVELALIQNTLRSFAEMVELFPDDLKEAARFGAAIEPTDESGRMLNMKEFHQYLSTYIDPLPTEIFDQFMIHMSKCAQAHHLATAREARRIILTNLFLACDHSGIGILDRHRILDLFESFWDAANDDLRRSLRNPRRWPVVEVDETEDSLSDDEDLGMLDDAEEREEMEDEARPAGDGEKVEDSQGEAQEQKDDEDSQKPESAEKVDDSQETQQETEGEAKKEETEEQKDEKQEEQLEKKEEGTEENKEAKETKPDDAAEKAEDGQKAESDEQKEEGKEKADEEKDEQGEEKKEEVKEAQQESGEENMSATEKQTEEQTSGTGNPTDAETAGQTQTEAETQEVSEKEQATQGLPEKEQDEAEPKEDDKSLKLDLKTSDDDMNPPGTTQTGRLSVTFAQGTEFDREIQTAGTVTSLQSQMSAFDEHTLNVSQFVHLTETFIGDRPKRALFETLLRYIKEGYEETEDEKLERLLKARKEALSSKRKVQMDNLFERWDNDGSGYLDLDEVEMVMLKYKDGQEAEAISRAKDQLSKKSKYHDQRLSKREFRTFIDLVVDEIPGDSFDYLVEFLASSIERSYADRVRGDARKKWLQQIVTAAETSGASLEPVYRAVFQALFKDAEAHGNNKRISANIAMLERNVQVPERGDVCLRYVASTPEDADYVLTKVLHKDMKGISFAAVESGKPIHVPRVANHGNIHFWNTHRHRDEREGSFIVIPLKDRRKRVFGVMGVDTLSDPHTKAIFITHEIQFFQGVAKAFSVAYHHVDMRKKLLRITESAVSWIQRRSPHVTEVVFYMVEPDGKGQDYVLRKMMMTDNRGNPVQPENPARLERKDNLFRDYLFKSVDNSESVTADAYGERHLAFPLRDDQGRAVAIIDISIGTMKKLPAHENKEALRMLRLLQMAHKEIASEFAGEESMRILDAEKDDNARMDIMFDRLMLMELRDNVTKLDTQAYAELKSYNEPPAIILDILKATIAIFYLEKVETGEFDDWTRVKGFINADLNQKIADFDPTAQEDLLPSEKFEHYLRDVPHGEVAKYGSLPAQHLYNWVFVCLSLIEHTRKMRQNKMENAVPAEADSAAED